MPGDASVQLSWGWHHESGRMRHVDSVPRGKASGCACAECGEALVAKKGEARKRRYHFAHARSGQTGEGCRHKTAVWVLYQRFQDAIQRKEAVPFRWKCNDCKQEHTDDFAQGALIVKREEAVPGSRITPDISLYREGDLCRLIEVVDTHKPEQHVRDYARESGVSLVVVEIGESTDLNATIEAEVWEGNVCPTMPDQETLAKVMGHLRGDIDVLASRYEAEFVDIPGLTESDAVGSSVWLKEGEYAVGVLERIQWPPTGGHRVRVYLRHLKDTQFLVPVLVPDKCEDLRDEAALIGKVVLLHCIVVGVNFVTGNPRRRYRIRPLRRTLRRGR